MSVATYDRKKSKVKEEKLAEFIMGDLTEDLQSVPGVGPTTAKQLNDAGIDTSFALVGKFLMCRKAGEEKQETCNRFVQFLQSCGVGAYRSGITTCILDKIETLMPGLFEDDE